MTLIFQVKNDLKGQPLKEAEDETLVLCWKGTKPFKSLDDVRKFFKPLALRFTNSNVRFEIPPEAYLIISVSSSNLSFNHLYWGTEKDLWNGL